MIQPWTQAQITVLKAAFDQGGIHAARAAFPSRTPKAVSTAIGRHIRGLRTSATARPAGTPKVIDLADVRRRLNAMPIEQFVAGFERIAATR